MDPVDQLNFHHLRYFWVVVREGGLAPAGRALRLSHSTLSAQIQQLSAHLGAPLFHRVGRKLVLTEQGELLHRYADEIFSRGRDLVLAMRGDAHARVARLQVGVVDLVPKMVARKLLEVALAAPEPVRLVVRESSFDRLLGELAAFELDLILSDAPLPAGSPVRAYAHPLGRSSVSWFAADALARKLARGFPQSLDGAPVLLPLEGLPMRRALEGAFARMKVRPHVIAELEDSALLKSLGASGVGAFPAPTAVAAEVTQQYRVRALGTFAVHERFFMITPKRRVDHPTIATLLAKARAGLFT